MTETIPMASNSKDDGDSPSPPPRRTDKAGNRSPHHHKRRLSRNRSPSPPPSKRSRPATDRRFGYDQYEREQGGRPGYADERSHGRYAGRSSGGNPNWDSGRAGYDVPNAGSSKREGLISYKQFIKELEDDILPSEAEHRYQEYKSEYISTQKRDFFKAHKDEKWLKDKYHPTNLVTVLERRNDLARNNAEDFLLDLQSGTLDLGPGLYESSSSKAGETGKQNSDDEADVNGRIRRHGKPQALSAAPKAHPVSSEPKRVQIDVEQSHALVRKLDSEKGIEDNILCRSENDRSSRDNRSHGSGGPVVIVRGSASVKGLEGIELLDTLITYLWRIHGVDYYGLVETSKPKGLRHVRIDGKSSNGLSNGTVWGKALDTRWQERLRGQDPLEVMAAKDKIDGAAVEGLDPYVRKIRDEKYGWKYGCGAKGCTKLFHAAEFVHKHLKLKHTDLVAELTSKLREDLYFQNYMDDEDAPGGTPVMQPSVLNERPPRRRPIQSRLKDDRHIHRERDDGDVDRNDQPQPMDDGSARGNVDLLMFDSFGGQGLLCTTPSFSSDMVPPSVLMPVPGAGPLGPFVPAPPEVAMRMLREQGGPSPFEGSGRNGRPGQGSAPILALPQGFRQDPRRLRSYQDLDAPDDEVTVIDYRSL